MDDLRLHGLLGGGSNVKSIQRGSAVMNMNVTGIDVALSAIDRNKSIVKITVSSNNTAGDNSVQTSVQAVLTASTLLTLTRTDATNDTVTIAWEVIEFNNVKSKQVGFFTTTSGLDYVTIANINTQKSILFFSYKSVSSVSNISTSLLSGSINSSTTLMFRQASPTSIKEIYWQVIEFN